MAIPSFKQININNSTKESIYEQLEPSYLSQFPYILDISQLVDQFEAITYIEQFLEERYVTNYPYPIYIISSLKNYHGKFSIFESSSLCPIFFKQKAKQLNARENKIMQKIYLKQKNLKNLQGHNFENDLQEYSEKHKQIFYLHKERIFLSKLNKTLEKYYE